MSGILMMSVGNSYGSLPVNTVAPVVSGTAEQGQTLSTTNGTWTGAPAPTFTYQWQRNTTNISGATSSTYVVQAADAKNTIRCVVTATNPSGAVSANSNSTATVPLVIGQAYAGGFYTGNIIQGGVTYELIVAPLASGQSGTSLQQKTSNTGSSTDTRTLNNGPAASAAMNDSSHPAAQYCEGLSIGGFTDWYLPARDELELAYRNLKPTTDSNSTGIRDRSAYTYPEGNDVSGDTQGRNRNSSPAGAAYTTSNPAQTSVTIFRDNGSEQFGKPFESYSYWCSTEWRSDRAYYQSFTGGNQSESSKTDSYRVRAFRRVAA